MKLRQIILVVTVAAVIAFAFILWPEFRLRAPMDPAGDWGCGNGPQAESSGAFLLRTAHCLLGDKTSDVDAFRLALVGDLYIKSWSYSLLNKCFFWLSVFLAVLVLLYPGLGPVFKHDPGNEANRATNPNWFQRAITNSAVQTSVTALAAFSFAFYTHYKEKQSVSENLMREIIFAREIDEKTFFDPILARIQQMDQGFVFSTAALDPS